MHVRRAEQVHGPEPDLKLVRTVRREQHHQLQGQHRIQPVNNVRPVRMQEKVLQVVRHVQPERIQQPEPRAVRDVVPVTM